MKNRLSRNFGTFLILVALGAGIGGVSIAQSQKRVPVNADAAAAKMPPVDKPESKAQNEEFRHSDKVQWIARTFGLDVDKASLIFEDVNSAILIGAILFGLWMVLPKAFRNRTATLQKQLIEARTATEEANERLRAVEARLARLDQDIVAIREQVERDAVDEEKRIRQSMEEERKRIVDSAEQEIDAAGAAAQRELKRFAAELAIDRATKVIQLSPETDRLLVQRFGSDLAELSRNGGHS